jgi:hypothetical protein
LALHTDVELLSAVADRRMWREHPAVIAGAGHRVIAMDLPGFGEAPLAQQDAPWADVPETMDGQATSRRSSSRARSRRMAALPGAAREALVSTASRSAEGEPHSLWSRHRTSSIHGLQETPVTSGRETMSVRCVDGQRGPTAALLD